MNKRKILGMLLIAGASVAAVGSGTSHLNMNVQNNKVLLSRTVNNKEEDNVQSESYSHEKDNIQNNGVESNKNESNTQNTKVTPNTRENINQNKNNDSNTTLSKKEVKSLKNKTIEAYGMKFSGLKTMKIAPDMPAGGFAVAPGFNSDGFASSVNEQLYDYELNPANDNAAMNEATYLHGGNPVDTCVFFQSSALRGIGQQVPDSIGYTTHLENWLGNNGWTRHEDFQFIQRGDLCFASYYHTFLFMGWENKDKGIAYVMGNESFTEPYYRNRNLNGQSPVTYGNNSYYQATCYWTYGQGYTGAVSGENPVHSGGYNAIGTATTTSELNIRGEANSWSNILGSVPSGVTVPVIAQNGAWYKVYYNGATGWIDGNYTNGLDESLGNGANSTNMPQGDNLTVTSPSGLWLTYGPSANSGNIVSLPNGTPVKAVGWHDGWYKVNYEGTLGWLDADYTSANGADILSSSHNVSATPQPKQNVPVPTQTPTQSGVQGTLTISSPIGLWMCNGPNANSGNIVVVPNNTQLTYKAEENGWYEVSYNGETGWVDGQYVNLNGNQPQKTVVNSNNGENQNKPVVQSSTGTATVNSPIGLWLNANPSMGSGIEVMPSGANMKVLGQQGDWTKVDYNGNTGWCYTQYININENSGAPTTSNQPTNSSSTGNNIIGNTTITSPIGLWQVGSPSMGGSHIQVIPYGTKVNVYGEQNGWYKVSYNGQVGWSYAEYTSGLNNNQGTATNKSGSATVNSPIGLWINAGPSMGNRIEVAPYNATVQVLGQQGDWTKVNYNGQTGWMYSSYLTF